jgi:hypothetical protein
MAPLASLLAAAAGGSGFTLVAQRLWRSQRIATDRAAELEEPERAMVERWNAETVRLAYEHAHEFERTLDSWADQIDSKAATIYGVAGIVAGLASSLGLAPSVGVARTLWLAALVVWGLSAVACWVAFKTRDYSMHPHPPALLSANWLAIDPGRFYLKRLRQVVRSYRRNGPTLRQKERALNVAIGLATLEIILLLAALWTAAPRTC